jgi:hypothetical protein
MADEGKDSKGADDTQKLSALEEKIKQVEADNFKLREERREAKVKFEQFEKDKKSLEESKLTEAKEFEKLYKMTLQKNTELETNYEKLQGTIKDSKKTEAVMTELHKFGFDDAYRQDALGLIDRKQIAIDEETGLVIGAERVVKDFVTKYATFPYFKKGKTGANHNGTSSQGSPNIDLKSMSVAQLKDHFRKKQETGR